jgi:hypothetical protein
VLELPVDEGVLDAALTDCAVKADAILRELTHGTVVVSATSGSGGGETPTPPGDTLREATRARGATLRAANTLASEALCDRATMPWRGIRIVVSHSQRRVTGDARACARGAVRGGRTRAARRAAALGRRGGERWSPLLLSVRDGSLSFAA